MILRLFTGHLHAPDPTLLNEIVRVAEVEGLDGATWAAASVRHDPPGARLLAISLWRDLGAIAAVDALAQPTPALRTLGNRVAFAAPEHFELADGEGVAPPPAAAIRSGAIGLVRCVVPVREEPLALALVRDAESSLQAAGLVRVLLVGRRARGSETELVVAAVWPDRDLMRTYFSERPHGPGFDPRFLAAVRDLRFETFDLLDMRRPAVPAPRAAVLVVDRDRRIVDGSAGVEPLLGIPAESLIGHPFADLFDEAGRSTLDAVWPDAVASGASGVTLDTLAAGGERRLLRHRLVANVPAQGLTGVLLEHPADAGASSVEGTIRRALGTWRSTPPARPRHLGSPRLLTVPQSDRLFARMAHAALHALGVPTARRLQLHLRALYPRTVVHRRELSAEDGQTWYVYRDGRVRPPVLPAAWWREPAVAAGAVDRAGRIVAADDGVGSLLGADPALLVGREVSALGFPGSDGLGQLLRFAWEEPEAESTAHVVAGGRDLDLEIHTSRGDETLRFELATLPAEDDPGATYAPICLPASDHAFIARVEDLCGRLGNRPPAEMARELEVRLRVKYPDSVVRSLGRLIGFGPRTHVLVAYRDGEQSPYAGDLWWEASGVARVTFSGERYAAANEAAAALHGTTVADLVGSSVSRFYVPHPDRPWLSALLDRMGTLHTTTRLRRPDGSIVEIEYRAVRDVSGEQPVVHVTMRPVTRERLERRAAEGGTGRQQRPGVRSG